MQPASVLPFESFEIPVRNIGVFSAGLIAFGYEMIVKDHVQFRIIIEMGSRLLFIFDVEAVLERHFSGILPEGDIWPAEDRFSPLIKGQNLHPFLIAAEAIVVKT